MNETQELGARLTAHAFGLGAKRSAPRELYMVEGHTDAVGASETKKLGAGSCSCRARKKVA